MRERRRHIRVRPTADHDVVVELRRGDFVELLSVLDISVSGLGLYFGTPLAGLGTGDTLALRIRLPHREPFDVDAVLRHVGGAEGSACGLELVSVSDGDAVALRRYVSELLERGQAV